jgi:uncharacterized protein
VIDTETIAAPEPVVEGVPWRWRDLLIVVAAIIVGTIALVAGVRLLNPTAAPDSLLSPALFIAGLGIYLVVALAVVVQTIVVRRARWADLGLRWPPMGWLLAIPAIFGAQIIGLALINLAVAALLGVFGVSFENPQVGALIGEGTQSLSPRDLVVLLALVAVAAPIAEELFFRGMLHPLLRQRLRLPVALLCNGALFAVAHFIPLLLPALLYVGVVLTFVRERSGSLIPSIILHALQNGSAVILLYVALQMGEL